MEDSAFGSALAIGFVAVLALLALRSRSLEMPFALLHGATLVAFAAGAIGARLAWVILVDREIDPATIGDYSRGTMVYGFLIAAGLAASVVARASGVSASRLLDACAPAWVLMQISGRIGCHFAGCCYGQRPLGTTASLLSHLGLDRHPTQLYEAAALVVLAVVLSLLARRRLRSGVVALAYVLLYGAIRFPLEFLRADHRGAILDGALSTSQAVALVSMAFAAAALLRARIAPSRSPCTTHWHLLTETRGKSS